MLDGIATLLLSLADLADAAAHRSWPVRWLVLWALWQADATARDFVAGSAWNPAGRLWSAALARLRHGSGPADAIALAMSLRALAGLVRDMAMQRRRRAVLLSLFVGGTGRGDGLKDGGCRAARTIRRILGPAPAPGLPALAGHDTS